MRLVNLAACNLNQWAMDFEGNLARIIESIRTAKATKARFRVGPELEVSGYGCEDHFHEPDTFLHTWESLRALLLSDVTDNILCDIGACIKHQDTPYICRVFILSRKIVMIRPKSVLANGGNFCESRWFTSWNKGFILEDFYLPRIIREVTGQDKVPFGIGAIASKDTVIASECWDELCTPKAPHIRLGLDGVEIFSVGGANHHVLRGLQTRTDLIRWEATKCGGVYVYANHRGCDGGRLYYDGSSLINVDGDLVAQASQFSLKEVEVIVAAIDLEEIRSFRASFASRAAQASVTPTVPRVDIDFELSSLSFDREIIRAVPIPPKLADPMAEVGYGPACWLWDYLRRSGLRGFLLPLDGELNSSAVAVMVFVMCTMVTSATGKGDPTVLAQIRKVLLDPEYTGAAGPRDLCRKLLTTCFFMEKGGPDEENCRRVAQSLSSEIGSVHQEVATGGVLASMQNALIKTTMTQPSDQNVSPQQEQQIRASCRTAMVHSMAKIFGGGSSSLLVLGAISADDMLRGGFLKHDVGANGDLNPIGGMSKVDLQHFLVWVQKSTAISSLGNVLEDVLKATGETTTMPLVPLNLATGSLAIFPSAGPVEDQISTADLLTLGQLRKIFRCGPFSMFQKLLYKWKSLAPDVIAAKVKHFFCSYAVNRHKMTVMPPAYYADPYGGDDSRPDMRPLLYNPTWLWRSPFSISCSPYHIFWSLGHVCFSRPWQFEKIDAVLNEIKSMGGHSPT